MKKKTLILLTIFILWVAFASVAIGQTADKGWEKTVTLPNGDVILDMSGEWDVLVEHYGPASSRGEYSEIEEIKQEGISFVAVTLIESENSAKGTEKLKGELDKNGFRKVQTMTEVGPLVFNSKILLKGNKLIFDEGQMLKLTYTRRP